MGDVNAVIHCSKTNETKLKQFSFQITLNNIKNQRYDFTVTCFRNLPELSIILDSDSDLFSLILTDFLPLFRAADRQSKTG